MYLKHCTLTGFKSFARQSTLEFNSPITAIVGPNGSGKSNIAEAFRFVLGEQSFKTLRSKRGEDLIFDGTQRVPRANRASVAVTFDNRRRLVNIDYDEVILERAVHRDGTSEYSINGSQVRLRDVQELLAGANIGASGHHIISQGEADKMLNSSPKARREMIEDALGLKVYQFKKGESEKKLAKTNENIEQVNQQRREIRPHLNYLAKQVQKLEKARELRQQLREHYREYLKREQTYLAVHEQRVRQQRAQPAQELERISNELSEAKATRDAKRDDGGLKQQLHDVERQLSAVRAQRDQVSRQLGNIEGQLTALKRQQREPKQHSRSNTTHPPIAYERVAALQQELASVREQVARGDDHASIRQAIDALEQRLRSLLAVHHTTDNDAPQNEQDSHEQQGADNELQRLEREQQDAQQQMGQHEEHERTLNEQYAHIKQQLNALQENSREAERAVFELTNRYNELKEQIASFDRQAQTLARDRASFESEVQEAISVVGAAVREFYDHTPVDAHGSQLSDEVIADESREQQRARLREIEKMRARLEDIDEDVGDDVLQEYKDTKERDEFLARELEDLQQSADSLKQLIADLDRQLDQRFKEGLETINREFSQFFSLLFGGGSAKVTLVQHSFKRGSDESDDDERNEQEKEGLDISLRLPKKRIKGLEMLSGGERALTSIALLFAMSQVNPPPFLILDETDAALDEANSRKYSDMIEHLAQKSQLILITHNRETMSRAGVLYGITMSGDGVSQLLSVQFADAAAYAK
jgi:chromosome segregation protein